VLNVHYSLYGFPLHELLETSAGLLLSKVLTKELHIKVLYENISAKALCST
jgi:hypothetical protein